MLNQKGVQHMWALFGLSCTSAQFMFSLIFSTKAASLILSFAAAALYRSSQPVAAFKQMQAGKIKSPWEVVQWGSVGEAARGMQANPPVLVSSPLIPSANQAGFQPLPKCIQECVLYRHDLLQKHSRTPDDTWTVTPWFFRTPMPLLFHSWFHVWWQAQGEPPVCGTSLVSGQQTPAHPFTYITV